MIDQEKEASAWAYGALNGRKSGYTSVGDVGDVQDSRASGRIGT